MDRYETFLLRGCGRLREWNGPGVPLSATTALINIQIAFVRSIPSSVSISCFYISRTIRWASNYYYTCARVRIKYIFPPSIFYFWSGEPNHLGVLLMSVLMIFSGRIIGASADVSPIEVYVIDTCAVLCWIYDLNES